MSNCLTTRLVVDFDVESTRYSHFVSISQFDIDFSNYRIISSRDILNKVYKGVSIRLLNTPTLFEGRVLYGVNDETNSLIWLGEVIDSSD